MGTDHTPAAALTARARELWECLAGAAAGFTPAMSVAVVPRSYLCPPGWAGIVVLGSAALATAPDHDTARLIEQALSGQPAASLTDTGVLSSRLPAAEILGPASLAYLDPAEFRPQPGHAVTTPVGLDHPGFRQFLLAADTDDAGESGIGEITTPAFAIREHGQVVAAAGYRDWPCGTAHLSVLTASAARGRGLAQAAASAAVAHAIAEGRLPQWRARPPGLPARRPRSRIPRTRRPGEHPPRCCGHFPRTSILTRPGKGGVVTREHRRLRAELMDRRLVVRHDVDRDDRRRLSQGNRLSALREGPPVGASSRRRLSAPAAFPSHSRAVPSESTEASCRPSGLNATACTP